MTLLHRFVGTATKLIGSVVLILMALQIVVDVFMRNLVGAGFPATTDLVSKYYMILVSFLPIAYAELQRRHVEAYAAGTDNGNLGTDACGVRDCLYIGHNRWVIRTWNVEMARANAGCDDDFVKSPALQVGE